MIVREIIKKMDSSLLEISAIEEYLNQFKNYKVICEGAKKDYGRINISCNGELISLLFQNIADGKWWSICRYHSNYVKYEQIDVIIFNIIKEEQYDTVIKYSGHIEDDSYSYITCSCFSYLNNEFVSSWKSTRVVPIQDLMKIQYSKNMNLTELICVTDEENCNIIKKEEQENIKTLVLKLEKINN